MTYTLRPYQKECIEAVEKLPDGARSIVCLATGLGKSLVGSCLPHKGRMLWLSHRDELVRQPQKYFDAQGMSFGIEKAGEHSNGEDVVSASIQTICKDSRLHSFAPDEFDLVVCDEAHHAAADTYKKVLTYFHPRKLIGLTATPRRGDQKGLTDVFDSICFVRDLRWGIENGYLSHIRNVRAMADFDMNALKKQMGDFTEKSLTDVMEDSDTDEVIKDAYFKYCEPEKKQTLVFCPSLQICNKVLNTLRDALPDEKKPDIAILYNGMPVEQRHLVLDLYHQKKIHCIVNCMILTEGADLPETSVIINARPTANSTLYQQIVGRGTRLAEGKDYCLIIDVIGENYKEKNICTAPTLLGIDSEAVSDKLMERLDENEDLLDFARAFDSDVAESVNFAEYMNVRYEVYNIFTQEREEVAEAEGSYKEKAKQYQKKFIDPYTKEPGFDGLCIYHTPANDRYYMIQATYHDKIYIAKPDLLNRTRVTMERTDLGPSFVTDLMPMQSAISMIRDYLTYVVPKQYAPQWSLSGRNQMAQAPATVLQLESIQRSYGVASSNGLTKLDAHDLIQMKNEIKEAAKQAKTCSKIALGADSEGKEKKIWLRNRDIYFSNEKKEQEQLHANAPEAMKKIVGQIVLGKQKEKAEKEAEERNPVYEICIPVTGTYIYTAGYKPSDRQISLAYSLIRQIKEVAKVKEPANIYQMSKWQIGIFIDGAKKAVLYEKGKANYYPMEVDLDELCSQASALTEDDVGTKVHLPVRFLISQSVSGTDTQK